MATILLLAPHANAAPTGKAWTAIEGFEVPGFDYLIAPRFELQPSGFPKLIVSAVKGNAGSADALAFNWDGSSWVESSRMEFDAIFLHPVGSPAGRYPLVFVGGEYPATSRNLYWAELVDHEPTVPEYIASTSRPFEVNYGGATNGLRRWAAIQDNFENNGFLRLFSSDGPGQWNEILVTEPTADGVSLLAHDDSTALVVWAINQHDTGLRWGLLSSNHLMTTREDLVDGYPYSPRLRAHPTGGAWLTWGTNESTGAIRRFDNGAWGPVQRLPSDYTTDPFGVNIYSAEMSRDSAERPALVWAYQSFLDGSGGVCVCIPNATGWEVGEELYRGSNDASFPTVARDRNGDTWVAWSQRYQPFRWTHTYTSATASTPRIDIVGGRPLVSWVLSASAPESWWSVLRQQGTGPFQEVSRLKAGPGLEMSWLDQGYRPGTVLRDGISYRIRRESVDSRYEWLSPVGSWTPGHRRLHLAVSRSSPDGITLELSGATGERVDVFFYDVTGRMVQRRELQLRAGMESQTFPLTFGALQLPAGVFFARARDASGALSGGIKVVRLD